MTRILDHLVAGLIAAVITGAVAVAAVWKITASQREFAARQFGAQNAMIQTVGDELAKTAGDLKRLDGALKATEATLREVKDQVALVGTRTGIARLSTSVEAATRTLTALQAKLDDKARDNARDLALARIETALAGVKDAIAKQPPDPALTQASAKLDDALKSLAAIGKTTDALKSGTDADAAKLADVSKSLTALDTSVKQGFADVASKQADVMKAVAKPAPTQAPPPPAEPKQDLVVFYLSMEGKAAAPPPAAAPGLTPAVPPPFAVRFERLGGVDDEGQTKLIVGKLRDIIKGHSGCTIAVVGHADTLGGDRTNYELSKRRADEVADKLRAAFAGDKIKIDQTQWGERRLKEWTPDGIAREANRRVDVAVSCEK